MKIFRHLKLVALLLACVAFIASAAYYERHSQPITSPAATIPVAAGTTTSATTTPLTRSTISAVAAPSPQESANPVSTSAPSSVRASVAAAANVTSAMLIANGKSYALSVPANTSVADAMQQLANEDSSFTYTTRQYPSLGLFVESIGGKTNSGNAYWFLYVNGKESDTGISSTVVHQGDVIEWKYQL